MNDGSPTLRELFERALALSPEERRDFLNTHCVDPELRTTLQRMLDVDSGDTGRLLDRSVDSLMDEVGEWTAEAPAIGTSIGPFRLLECLGSGGSSIVYRAEREQAGVRQQVALKLLRRGLLSVDEQRRFRDERRALTRLQHPGIARLIEGDITEEGTAYIALELVEGNSIIEHARSQRLDLAQRLRLIVDVCRAVDAAHRALIVHRDLKPSNVMVTVDGEVKLLDFGIAKLLAADSEEEGASEHHLALTPAYAAPEQFERGVITTATDVYALGVVVGELITGQRREPGDSRTPSSQLENCTQSEERTESLKALRRKLRGDLDAIVMKATATAPPQRYASAGALADDIARYLDGQPVVARPSSRLYSLRKFVGRHRGGVATTVLFLLAILTSLGIALWQANVARAEAQRAASVRDFLLRVFSAAEPAGPRLAPPTVVDVVRASITEAQHSPTLYPAVRIELLEALGNVLRTQGQVDDSIRLLESNYSEAISLLGASNATTLKAGLGLAMAWVSAGKQAQARILFDQILQLDAHTPTNLRSRVLAASALLAVDLYERERAFKESDAAMELCNKNACDEPTRINAMLARGNVLANFQQDEAAIPIMQQALNAQRALFAGPHIDIAESEQALSRAYRRLGQFDRAEALARDSLEIVEASVTDPHVRRSDALDTLRQVLIDTRRFDEAEALGERIIAMDKATLGPEHPGVATSQNTLGFTYMMDTQFDQAAKHFQAALDLSERIPDNARRSAIYRANLGVSIGRNGDLARGMQMIRVSIAALRALPEPDYDQICSALEKLGAMQRFGGDPKASLASYSESVDIYREKLPDAPKAWRVVSLTGMGRALVEVGDDAKAADAFNEALANDPVPPDRVSPDRIEARAALAGVMFRRGELAAAQTLLDQAQQERKAAKGRLSTALQAYVDSIATSMSRD